MGRRTLQTNFLPTNPCCHGNAIWDKMGYNLASVKDMSGIFSCSCSSNNTIVVVVVSAFSMHGVYVRLATI